MKNNSATMGFILVGFSFSYGIQATMFTAFLLVYIIALLGNMMVIAVIKSTAKLHTPMYFFLLILSCLDIISVSVTVPRMLSDLLARRKYISFNECFTQVFVILLLPFTDVLILTAMCYDRYVAICNPLNYSVLVSRRFCVEVVYCSSFCGILFSLINTFLLSRLPFCGEHKIDNVLCEFPALLRQACADTFPNEIVLFAMAGGVSLATLTIIFMSYMHIIRVIMKIPSTAGKRKVFSTCSAHLIVVFLFFGTGAGTHLKPSKTSSRQDKWASLFYTVFAPMLNPIIYSLRNEDVKQALVKAICRRKVYT